MSTLRDILREQAPELHQALETSWQIAEHDWIPTLRMEGESHAGGPHLRGVEEWMDRLAEACRPRWSVHGNQPFGLNPMEVYILLASTLFHDIGRGRLKGTKEEPPHGEVSRAILDEHWAQLGIVDGRISHEIGLICEYHTVKDLAWRHHDVTQIHPWGMVHTEALAALLTLADELDTAYTRAAPAYMKDKRLSLISGRQIEPEILDRMEDEFFTKGLYRESISSVQMDPGAHLLKTVLFHHRLPGPLEKGDPNECAEVWLKQHASVRAPQDRFTVDDFFFSFLDVLRMLKTGDPTPFLARQYYRARDFRHMEVLASLRLPASGPVPDDLMRHTFLWDRQVQVIRPVDAKRTLQDVESLEATLELIRRTVSKVDEMIADREVTSPTNPRMSHVADILTTVCASLWAAHRSGETIESEMRKGSETTDREILGRIDCPDVSLRELRRNRPRDWARAGVKGTPWWKLASWKMEEIARESAPSTDPPLSGRRLHEALVVLMHSLTFVVLDGQREKRRSDDRGVPRSLKLPPRRPHLEAWSVEEYHANLLHAFQFYLRCVRRVLRSPVFDSEVLNGTGSRKGAPGFLGGLYRILRFGELQDRKKGEGKPDLGEPQQVGRGSGDLISALDILAGSVKEVVRLWREKHRQHGGIETMDLEFAVRFMFMQWLSSDIREKSGKLEKLQAGLRKLDIPFTHWMIEYSNQLFDHEWHVRIEPSLKGEELDTMLRGALDLWGGVQTRDHQIPWESLAARVREPKRDRVRSAANRLDNLLFLYESYRKPDKGKATQVGDTKEAQPHFWDFMAAQCTWTEAPKGTPRGAIRLKTGSSGWSIDGTTPSDEDLKAISDFLRGFDTQSRKKANA